MSRRAFVLVVVSLLGVLQACSGTSAPADGDSTQPTLDPTDPVQVVAAVFAVAGGHLEPTVLGTLCDPKGENDGDTRRICDYAGGFDPEGEFPMFFKEGKITGPAQIEGDLAYVPFVFGPDGDEEEVMVLVRRNGKWYLGDF